MDACEIRARKKALAREISKLIESFEKEAGVGVTDVVLDRAVSVCGDGTINLTSPEVRITVEI